LFLVIARDGALCIAWSTLSGNRLSYPPPSGGAICFDSAIAIPVYAKPLVRSGLTRSLSAAGTRIDAERRRLPLMVRASLHYYNTQEEIDRFIGALETLGA
jgi:hypothetical protein